MSFLINTLFKDNLSNVYMCVFSYTVCTWKNRFLYAYVYKVCRLNVAVSFDNLAFHVYGKYRCLLFWLDSVYNPPSNNRHRKPIIIRNLINHHFADVTEITKSGKVCKIHRKKNLTKTKLLASQ